MSYTPHNISSAFHSSLSVPIRTAKRTCLPYFYPAIHPMSLPFALPSAPLRRGAIQAITRRMSDIKKYHYPDGADKQAAKLFRKKVKRAEKKERERENEINRKTIGFGAQAALGLQPPRDNHRRAARERDAAFYRFYRSKDVFDLDRRAMYMLDGKGAADTLLELLRGRYMDRYADRLNGRPVVLTFDIPYLYNDLIEEINKCDEVYYAPDPPDKPRVIDAHYDELITHLIELEREFPQLIDADRSPSQRVGHCAAARASKLGLDKEVEDRDVFEKLKDEGDSLADLRFAMNSIQSFRKTVPIDLARPTQYRHRTPMLSLDNARSHDDLAAFFRRAQLADAPDISAELKIDGVALSLEYRNGLLYAASTRGSGRIGDDITRNVTAALLGERGVVRHIDDPNVPDWMLVRGEVYISSADFKALNETLERKLSNARNAAAGALQHKNAEEAVRRRVRFVAYDCLCAPLADIEKSDTLSRSTAAYPSSAHTNEQKEDEETQAEESKDKTNVTEATSSTEEPFSLSIQSTFETQEETLRTLERWGFGQMPRSAVCKTLAEAEAFEKQVEEERAELPMEIDGIVFKWNNSAARAQAGSTARAPRGAIAYKFTAQARVTRLDDVVFQVSRTGIITPVAVLSPVRVGGALLSRATLHNFDEVERLGIAIGDTVRVERGGDVIPKIVGVVSPSDDIEGFAGTDGEERKREEIKPPKSCPCCGAPVKEAEQRGKGGSRIFMCGAGEKCSAQAFGRVLHFASRQAMDIQGLGRRTVHKLVDAGFIVVIADLFRLTRDDILTLKGFAEHSADNLLREIEKARMSRSFERVLIGLGLPGIGRTGARSLALKIGSLNALIRLADPNQTKYEEAMATLLSVANVAERTAKALVDFLRYPQHLLELRALARLVQPNSIVDDELEAEDGMVSSTQRSNAIDAENPVAGQSFAFTGKFVTINRTKLMKWVRSCGGRVMSDVSRKTDFVIFGIEPGQKLFKAQRLNVMTIDEIEFIDHFKVPQEAQKDILLEPKVEKAA